MDDKKTLIMSTTKILEELVLKHGWMSEDEAQKATSEDLAQCVVSRVEKLTDNQRRIYDRETSVKNSTGLQKLFVETYIGQPFNHEDRNEHFYTDVYCLCQHILDTIHELKLNGGHLDPSSVLATMQAKRHLNQDNEAAGMHRIAILLIAAELNPQFTDVLKPSKLFTLCYDMIKSKKQGNNIAHPSQLPDECMRATYDRLKACGNTNFARDASAHLYEEVCAKAENRNKLLPPDGYRSWSAPGLVRPRRLIDGCTDIADLFRDDQSFAPKRRWYPGHVNADRREWRPNPSMARPATPSRNDRMQHQQQNNVRSSQRRRDANRRSSHGGDDGRGGSSHQGHVGRGSESAGSQRCQSERARTPRIHQQSRHSEHRSESSRRAQNQMSSQKGPSPSICVSRGTLCHSSVGDGQRRSSRSSPERLPSGGGRGQSEPRGQSSRRAQNQISQHGQSRVYRGPLNHSSAGDRHQGSRHSSPKRLPSGGGGGRSGATKRGYGDLTCNLFGQSAKRARVPQEEEEEGEVQEDSY